ncbi:MAG: hypothetical protein LBR86_02720 [Tannerella sp.]|jgi:hypothetical protein|nr:hypothetical protein [Tannerella sp.]
MLTPDASLAPGAYMLMLTVGADGLTPISVEITFMVTPTGTENIETSALRVIAVGDGFLIRGIVPGETLSVYNLHGQLIYRTDAARHVSTTTEQRVPLHVRGVYVVVSGERRVKAVY